MTYIGAQSAIEDAVEDSLAAAEAAIPLYERERRDARRRYWVAFDRRLIAEADKLGIPLESLSEMEKAMSQQLTRTDPHTGEITPYEFSDTQIDLIRNMLDKDATDGELQLLIAVSQRVGLDPFAKEIYGISRYSKAAGRKVMAIQIGVDGLRKRAARSGAYAGQRGPFWCGEDGEWKDVWLSKEYPAAAKVGVVRKGETEPIWGVATWTEFAPIGQYGLEQMWKQYPSRMLAKVAESEALRKACPDEVANIRSVIIESGAEYEPALATGDVEGDFAELEEPKGPATTSDPEGPTEAPQADGWHPSEVQLAHYAMKLHDAEDAGLDPAKYALDGTESQKVYGEKWNRLTEAIKGKQGDVG